MDPNAAWSDLDSALTRHDRPAIAQAADALVGWIEKGGFLPDRLQTFHRKDALFFLRELRAVAEMV